TYRSCPSHTGLWPLPPRLSDADPKAQLAKFQPLVSALLPGIEFVAKRPHSPQDTGGTAKPQTEQLAIAQRELPTYPCAEKGQIPPSPAGFLRWRQERGPVSRLGLGCIIRPIIEGPPLAIQSYVFNA